MHLRVWLVAVWVLLDGSAAAARPQSPLKARATEAYRRGRFKEACEGFAQVVADDHFDAWGWNDLALCRVKAGQYGQVLEALDHAGALEKASPDEKLQKAMQTNLDLLAKALLQPGKEKEPDLAPTMLAVSARPVEPQRVGALLELAAATQPQALSQADWWRVGQWRLTQPSELDPLEALLQAGGDAPHEASSLPSVLPTGEGASWKQRCVPLVQEDAPCAGRWLACAPPPAKDAAADDAHTRRAVVVIPAASLDQWTVDPTADGRSSLEESSDRWGGRCGDDSSQKVVRIDACARKAVIFRESPEGGCGRPQVNLDWVPFPAFSPTAARAAHTEPAGARRALYEQAARTEEALLQPPDWNALAALRLESGDLHGVVEALGHAGESAFPSALKLPQLPPVTACTDLDPTSEAKCGRTWLRCPREPGFEVVIDAHTRKSATTVGHPNQLLLPQASLLDSRPVAAWSSGTPNPVIQVDVCAGTVVQHEHVRTAEVRDDGQPGEERTFERLVERPVVPLPTDLELIRASWDSFNSFDIQRLLAALPESDRARFTEQEWLVLGCLLLDTHRDQALALFHARLKPGAPAFSCNRLTLTSGFGPQPAASTDWKARCVPLDGAACGRRWLACHGQPVESAWPQQHDVVVLDAATLDAWKAEPTLLNFGPGPSWFVAWSGDGQDVFALDVCAGQALVKTPQGTGWHELAPLAPPAP